MHFKEWKHFKLCETFTAYFDVPLDGRGLVVGPRYSSVCTVLGRNLSPVCPLYYSLYPLHVSRYGAFLTSHDIDSYYLSSIPNPDH